MKGPKLLVWGCAAMVLLALGIALTRPPAPVRQDIGNAQLRDLQAKGARIVDVRSPGEYAIGHIAGAENVPVDAITKTATSWDRDQVVVVYCASGARSLNAAQWLAAHGFKKVYNLKAGITAWDAALTTDTSAPPSAAATNGKPVLIDFYSDT